MATMTPGEPRRFSSLDAIRGVAVMGILAMNIVAFAMPTPAYSNPSAYGGDSGLDFLAWLLNFVFVDAKMRGLFSMLFGASTLLVIARAAAAGRNAAHAHYARMAWLFVFGLLHFYLIWWGDILVLYALCGMILFVFRNLSVKALRRWAIGFLTVSFVWAGLSGGSLLAVQSGTLTMTPGPQAETVAHTLQQINNFMGRSPGAIANDLALHRGSYDTIMSDRLFDRTLEPIVSFLQNGLETLGLMLIGMALFKSRMVTGGWQPDRYRRWAIACFAIATPVLALLAELQIASGYNALIVFNASVIWSMPFDVVMTIGWAALIALSVQRGVGSAAVARLAATGRMAFTNYLATSLVMTTIFYGYGLGLFGEVSRAGLYLFVIGMGAAMLAWSKPWLSRFYYGPFEWLWRSLSRWSLQTMRRAPTAHASAVA